MPITMTETAAARLKQGLTDAGMPDARIRVWVEGMSCSGFRYGMGIDPKPAETTDTEFESHGLRVVVDPDSMGLMEGAEVDFIEEKGAFRVKNPNEPSGGCGCSGGEAEGGCGCSGGGEDQGHGGCGGSGCGCGG
ncbi:MAG: iron-sulfur cluster assembly accessory protein [Myxococcales bacterium]